MNVFSFTTATGQRVEVTGPAGSTYDQALAIFNQQQNTGSLVGLKAGDILNSLVQAKGGLPTALAQVASAFLSKTPVQVGPNVPNLPVLTPTNIPTFVNTTVAAVSSVPVLSNTQLQGLLSATAAAVNQTSTVITNEKGLGIFGLDANRLQQTGLIKPGTAELINQNPANLVSILSSPTVWTGKNGADNLESVLTNPTLQSAVQQSSLASNYEQLTQLGVINNAGTATNVDPYAGLDEDQIARLGNADPTDPYIRLRLDLPPLEDANATTGAIVNNATNFGLGNTLDWLKNTAGGSDIGKLTTSAIGSIFGINFGSSNQAISGGGNPLQTGVQAPKGYSNTVNRSVVNASFNSIIGNEKIPKNIFANPTLGVDLRTQATQLSTINQSASILLTQLASTTAGANALAQVPGANGILGVLKSGQGLVSEIQGAAQILDKVKNLPGVGSLLKDVPGSAEVLASFRAYGSELFYGAAGTFGLSPEVLPVLDYAKDFDAAALLEGSEKILEDAVPFAEEFLEDIASFW